MVSVINLFLQKTILFLMSFVSVSFKEIPLSSLGSYTSEWAACVHNLVIISMVNTAYKLVEDKGIEKVIFLGIIGGIFSFIFREGYPEVQVRDVQFAYDVEKLMDLDTKR